MSLVGKVGRTRPRARWAMALLYVLLSLGAVTTLFPFLLMVSTGMKGPTDQNDGRVIPAYFRDDAQLAAKYLDDKYAGNPSLIASSRLGAEASPAEVDAYRRFLLQLPPDLWTAGFRTAPNQVTSRLSKRYQAWLRQRYGNDIRTLNAATIDENVGFQTVQPPAEAFERRTFRPLPGRRWDEWMEFKQTLPAEFRVPVRTDRIWQEFLRAKTRNRLEDVPAVAGRAASFEEFRYPAPYPELAARRDAPVPSPELRALLDEFQRTALPTALQNRSVEGLWAVAQGSAGPRILPIAADEAAHLRQDRTTIAREFALRNLSYVFDYIALNGRALWNTLLFCLLAIGTQLLVNPIAAYALSRYPIRASGKILLFLLATMAFPAEVAMIPSFLLLKDLGLLNTFAALVLPTAASGYMIFLLKGFFDSLPQELFEAGQLDGAKEVTLMTRVALPLSKPVLGYLALLAFMAAYSAFLYAFLIAQDQKMWTLMVFVYQLQNVAPRPVMMAALTLAALPTLLVFLACQRVIMRGIVLPGER